MDRLTARLESRSLVKFILGLTNFDVAEIRALTQVYTLAGADIIDVAADPGIVVATRQAMEETRHQFPDLGDPPGLMVSVALERDPHIVGVPMNPAQQASVAPATTQALTANVQACLDRGADAVELHAAASDDASVTEAVAALHRVLGNRYLSVCLGTQGLSTPHDVLRQAKLAREIHGRPTMIQVEGLTTTGRAHPSSSLQGVALAQVLLAHTAAYVVLAGGANHWTRHLADMLGVAVHGVAAGTYARGLVPRTTNLDGVAPEAVTAVARAFVEQLRGRRP